jgi:hypothetical protein
MGILPLFIRYTYPTPLQVTKNNKRCIIIKMKKKVIFSLIILIAVVGITLATLVGLWIYTTKTNPYFDALPSNEKQQIKTLNPEQVIQMYYNAINGGNYKLALAVLSPRQLRWFCRGLTFKEFLTHKFRDAVEDALEYMKPLSGKIFNISFNYEERPTALPPLPPGAIELEVHIDYSDTLEEPDLWFLTLAKSPYDSHWQIDGFGTSP